MTLNVGHISGHVLPEYSDNALFTSPKKLLRDEVLFIEGRSLVHSCPRPCFPKFLLSGINIIANRLFGPPPRTSTYVCIWELDLGRVKGKVPIMDGRVILSSAAAFSLNFTDPLDAPAPDFALPLDPDSKHVTDESQLVTTLTSL